MVLIFTISNSGFDSDIFQPANSTYQVLSLAVIVSDFWAQEVEKNRASRIEGNGIENEELLSLQGDLQGLVDTVDVEGQHDWEWMTKSREDGRRMEDRGGTKTGKED